VVVEFQQGSLRLISIRIIVRTSDDFQSTGDPGGAEVAGMTIPEHGHIRRFFYGDITSSGDCIDPLAERCGPES
jgi:hypothetical protein